MSLPTSRNRTYAATSPIRSADLNDMQDCIVAYKHGSLQLPLSAAAFQPNALANGDYAAGTVPLLTTATTRWLFTHTTTSGQRGLGASVPLPAGTRITSVKFLYTRGGGTLVFEVFKALAGVASSLGSASDNSSSGVTTITISGINYTIETDATVTVMFAGGSTSDAFGGAIVTYDRL